MLEKVDSASEQDGSDELKCVLRGIPNSAFRVSEGDSLVAGDSGRSVLRVNVTPDSICISDDADKRFDRKTDYYFEATVSYGILRYEIRTKKLDAASRVQRHPDLFARDLMIKALEYFDGIGTEVHTLELNWSPEIGINDNYVEFMRHIKLGEVNSPETVTNAIYSTWSGKIAWELGFREVIPASDTLLYQLGWTGQIIVTLKRTEYIKIQIEESPRSLASRIRRMMKKIFAQPAVMSG